MPPPLTRAAYALLFAGGVAALLAGWIADDDPDARGPRRYVEAVAGRPGLINPLLADDDASNDLVALVFDGLMRIDDDGSPAPALAERWDVTPDGLTYTFVLRPDASWHDGRPVRAADVAFTVRQLQSPDFAGPTARATPWLGAELFVADERTVLVHLPQPAADFLSHAAIGLLPEHLLRDVAPVDLPRARFNRAPVGTGPYRLIALDDGRALLERNTSYARGSPALREIELRFVPDRAAQIEALRAGEASAALLGERPGEDERDLLGARDRLRATPLRRSAYVVLYLNNQEPPLDDVRLRRALLASIDRDALFAASAAHGAAGDGVVVPGSWASSTAEPRPATDVEALWAASGWRRDEAGVRAFGGRRLLLELVTNADPHRETLARAVAAQLERWGVQVQVAPVPTVQLLQRRLVPRIYQVALFGWEAAPDPDPYGGWHSSQITTQGRNIAAFQDRTADALLEAARTTLDLSERRDLYARFGALFQEQAPSLVLYYPSRTYLHPAGLEGLTDGLLFSPASRFRDVHEWRLRARPRAAGS
ncbi:MAG: peptide ABC transporter substrate-binding protein [Chloroflexi bacterium]|nr:peptide ABC transporter substrate-binding protein [Chloroflexota bacterium]